MLFVAESGGERGVMEVIRIWNVDGIVTLRCWLRGQGKTGKAMEDMVEWYLAVKCYDC